MAKRQRTDEPDGTDALSSRQRVEGAPPPAAVANVDVLDVLNDFKCIVAALQSQSTADALALLLALSQVSQTALECVTRACTQLCDAKHAYLLNTLLPPTARVSMSAGDEDRAVQDILWYETSPAGGKGGNKLLEAGLDGGKRGQQWKLGARMRIVHLLWVANGLISLGPLLPFGGEAAQQFYEEVFHEEGFGPKMYENRRGYAQVNWFQNLLARTLSKDGRNKPHVRFVLETLRQVASITVAGTDIPATRMASGYGWSRLLALDRQRVESTGGAKDGGQHLDAGPSEKRKQNAAAFATVSATADSIR